MDQGLTWTPRQELIDLTIQWASRRARKASEEEEWFDRVAFLLEEYKRDYERAVAKGVPPKRPSEISFVRVRRETKASDEAILRREAEAGVEKLRIEWRSDGYAEVQIEDRQPFTLTPSLASLIAVLAAERPGEPVDGLVGWKPYDQVMSFLASKGSTSVTRGAVSERIRKARAILRALGLNPFLLMTGSRKGARFALRSRASTRDRDDGER